MEQQIFPSTGAFATGIHQVSFPNTYQSPSAYQRSQPTAENIRNLVSPSAAQASYYKDDNNSVPTATPEMQHNTAGVLNRNHESNSMDMQIDYNLGRRVDVNLLERGEIVGRTSLYIRVLSPQIPSHGVRERLQILLTGQHRGKF